MTILHQLIAVESDKRRKVKSAMLQISALSTSLANRISGFVKVGRWFDEELEEREPMAVEKINISTTIKEELGELNALMADSASVSISKAIGNSIATGDIIVDGVTIAEKVPVSALLDLENELLNQYVAAIESLPVLDPTKHWMIDVNSSNDGAYVTTDPETTYRTRKSTKYITVAPATNQHPAQVAKQDIDETVGKYTVRRYSGALPVSEKKILADKAFKLLQAVRDARQKANSIELDVSRGNAIALNIVNYLSAI